MRAYFSGPPSISRQTLPTVGTWQNIKYQSSGRTGWKASIPDSSVVIYYLQLFILITWMQVREGDTENFIILQNKLTETSARLGCMRIVFSKCVYQITDAKNSQFTESDEVESHNDLMTSTCLSAATEDVSLLIHTHYTVTDNITARFSNWVRYRAKQYILLRTFSHISSMRLMWRESSYQW